MFIFSTKDLAKHLFSNLQFKLSLSYNHISHWSLSKTLSTYDFTSHKKLVYYLDPSQQGLINQDQSDYIVKCNLVLPNIGTIVH
jgi:hypothetical protein